MLQLGCQTLVQFDFEVKPSWGGWYSDYSRYVQFLADPYSKHAPSQNKVTVATEEPNLTVDERYRVESYENGTEVTLHYKRVPDDDDEKEAKFQRE